MASLNKYDLDYQRVYSLQNSDHINPCHKTPVYECRRGNENTSTNISERDLVRNEVVFKKYVGVGVSWVSLITEHLLSHPFVVLRRQCQVNNMSKKYHIIPITLIPVMLRLHKHQSITTLWKGLGSVLLIRGMTLGIEDLLSKLMPWPKEITVSTSLKMFFRHIMLKCVSLAVVTPFYSASLVETVQSNVASENPSFLDVFKEGALRFMHWGARHQGRLLPIWALIIPTVTFGLARYLFCMAVQKVALKLLQAYDKSKETKHALLSQNNLECCSGNNINAMLISVVSSDVLFFPLETVLHRLHLQGTRTIVDNLDSGYSVLPILTNYEGSYDCYDKIISLEGTGGLYKGFGAMVLQYAVHIMLVRMTKVVLVEILSVMRSTPKTITRTSSSVIYSEELQTHTDVAL